MKKPLKSAFFSLLVVLILGCSKPSDPNESDANKTKFVNYTEIEWVSTSVIYDTTAAQKPLSILYFTDDVCSDGFLMEYNTFLDSSVIVAINSSYNIARISTANDSLIQFQDTLMTGNQLFKLYNLVGVPSLLILDEQNKYFGRIQADYYPSDSFLVLLDFYVSKHQ